MQELWVQSLGQEDPMEEGMSTRLSILAWRIPWAEEPGGLQSTGSQRVGHDWSNLAQNHTGPALKTPGQKGKRKDAQTIKWKGCLEKSRGRMQVSQ